MEKLTAILCLTIVVLLGSLGVSWSADLQKGLDAANRGDFATALREWRPLAEQGDASAQNNLGFMYVYGKGVLQDYVRAHMWFNIAASSGGSKNSSKSRDNVAKKMTPSQVEKAQKLARECVRKRYKGC